MSLTIFLAICILGCDVLIYFLYEWAYGESKRIRARRASPRWAAETGARRGQVSSTNANGANRSRVIELDRKRERPARISGRPNAFQEQVAYRRMASSFGQVKRRA
jgi:hypothetical protein